MQVHAQVVVEQTIIVAEVHPNYGSCQHTETRAQSRPQPIYYPSTPVYSPPVASCHEDKMFLMLSLFESFYYTWGYIRTKELFLLAGIVGAGLSLLYIFIRKAKTKPTLILGAIAMSLSTGCRGFFIVFFFYTYIYGSGNDPLIDGVIGGLLIPAVVSFVNEVINFSLVRELISKAREEAEDAIE